MVERICHVGLQNMKRALCDKSCYVIIGMEQCRYAMEAEYGIDN